MGPAEVRPCPIPRLFLRGSSSLWIIDQTSFEFVYRNNRTRRLPAPPPPPLPNISQRPLAVGSRTSFDVQYVSSCCQHSWVCQKSWILDRQYGGWPPPPQWPREVLQQKILPGPKSIFPIDCNAKNKNKIENSTRRHLASLVSSFYKTSMVCNGFTTHSNKWGAATME